MIFRGSDNKPSADTSTSTLPAKLEDEARDGEAGVNAFTTLQRLRGIMSLMVVLRHLLVSLYKFPDYGYGSPHEDFQNDSLLQLPWIKTVYAGNLMVSVFFVISGYVESHFKLSAMKNRDFAQLQMKLASSAFRRPLRLYVPAAAAACFMTIAVWLGLYEWGLEGRIRPNRAYAPQQQQSSLLDQACLTWTSFEQLLHLTDWTKTLPHYNIHMWTIPAQPRSSMVLYLTLTAVSLCKRKWRLVFLVLAALVFIHTPSSEGFCTLAGAVLADIDVEWQGGGQQYLNERRRAMVDLCGVVCALYLGSFPVKDGRKAPGFQTLYRYKPPGWNSMQFWWAVSAIWLVQLARSRSSVILPIRRLVEGRRFLQVGNLSFCIYLLHGPVMHIVPFAIIPFWWKVLRAVTWQQQFCAFCLGAFPVYIPALLLASHVFSKYVEKPSSRLIREMEKFVFVE